MSSPERTSEGRFVPGQSGNPAGRPRGSRNRSTILAETMLEARVEELTNCLVNSSKYGSMRAMRMCFDRVAPLRKGRPVPFELPRITGHADAVEAASDIVAGVAEGELTPQEAEDLIRVIEAFERVRIARLERAASGPATAASKTPV